MSTTGPVDVEGEMASLCGVLNTSHARLVAIVADALADESWAIGGVRSPEHWLVMRAGLSPFRARQVVAVARRRAELPTVMGEFTNGQLSLDQVVVVARYAPAHVEASVAELAVNATVPQLRRALSRYSFDPPAEKGHHQQNTTRRPGVGDPAGDDPTGDTPSSDTASRDTASRDTTSGDTASADTASDDFVCGGLACGCTASAGVGAGDQPGWNGYGLAGDRSTAPAELSMSHDQWGRFTLRFTAPANVGALVEAALKEAKDALFRAGRPDVTWADALIEMAARSMGAIQSLNRQNAYRTYIHLDTEGAWLTGQPRLPVHIADKLTCDGILQPVWHTQGAPVNVGRAQRIVPARTRRLVEDRDRGCRYPGCATTTHVECHHVIHWIDGGPTNTPNLISLCTFHHDTHHLGDFTITGNADHPTGLIFTTRSGFPIRPGPTFTTPGSPGSPSETWSPPATAPPTIRYRGPTGESLHLRYVTFNEPHELAYT